jgi:hypothetical protein
MPWPLVFLSFLFGAPLLWLALQLLELYTIQHAIATLVTIFVPHVGAMPHQTRMLLIGDKVVGKVFPNGNEMERPFVECKCGW